MSKPIRIGIIGLSSSAGASLTGHWAKTAHLPYLLSSPHYTITALCNSSLSSAQKAIELYNLDPRTVKAHGSPESLAEDDNVDMVACAVEVTKHYALSKPLLEKGKMVFCEWPLARNLVEMRELAGLAREKGVRTMVGLQGRNGHYAQAVKSFIRRLGGVLSSSMVVYRESC
jgi:predicted dehydrogenase